MEYVIVCLIAVAMEIGLVYLFNKKEPEFGLNLKKYGILLGVGNIVLMAIAVVTEMKGMHPAVWFFGLCSYLFCLCIYDLKYRELPDWFHLIPVICYLYLWVRKGLPYPITKGLLTAVVAGLILMIVFLIRRDAIGIGDIKVILICAVYAASAVTGIVVRGMFLAFLCSLILLLFKKVDSKSGVPFVPFLFFGTLLMW